MLRQNRIVRQQLQVMFPYPTSCTLWIVVGSLKLNETNLLATQFAPKFETQEVFVKKIFGNARRLIRTKKGSQDAGTEAARAGSKQEENLKAPPHPAGGR
jgi:hypothetical protein